MKQQTLWGIPVEIDESATAQWYTRQEPWGCDCNDCRNFIDLSRQNKLPKAAHTILNKMNIAADKATYVCEIMPQDHGHLYQFSYRISGNILNEDAANNSIEDWGEVRCCHEIYPYGAPDFPTPHFDLEFWITLPWVLDDAE